MTTIDEPKIFNPNVQLIDVEDELQASYLSYMLSVVISRAIPDARDGLKPVHRRILYSMYENNYTNDKPYRKSARIVGDVIGKYHPHGDQAIYDAMVRLVQDFAMHLPLLDGQGNFGSIDNDPPAAMRYTEIRMAKSTDYLLKDISYNTVAFRPNYDGSEEEPCILPSQIPNLLVNGSGGIAVGVATNIPPHNLGEIIDACFAYIDHPDLDVSELMQYVKGPDFPTGGTIIGTSGINNNILYGKGSIIIRSKYHIEKISHHEAIIITEIPYRVNKIRLIESIVEAVKEKRIDSISDIRDESDRHGIRLVIELKQGAISDLTLNQLCKYTPMQFSFVAKMLALNGNKPQLMNLKDMIAVFIRFREQVISRRTRFLLQKCRDRGLILTGLAIAVRNIDEIVHIIRSAKDTQDATQQLLNKVWDASPVALFIDLIADPRSKIIDGKYYLSIEQVKAILDLKLHRLTAIGFDDIEQEINGISVNISQYLDILSNREMLVQIMKNELLEIKNKFAIPRRTAIDESIFDQDDDDLIPQEDIVVTLSQRGYIKRVPLSSYRLQNRGGKGRTGMSVKEEDIVVDVIITNTHNQILFFSSIGKVYKIKGHQIPSTGISGCGKPVQNILPLIENEKIKSIMPLNKEDIDQILASEHEQLSLESDESSTEDIIDDKDVDISEPEPGKFIVFATSLGKIRRNNLSAFINVQANGKIAMKLDEHDSIVGVKVCQNNDNIALFSVSGKCVRFPIYKVRLFKSRSSSGVRGINLNENDQVIDMTILKHIKYDQNDVVEYLKQSSDLIDKDKAQDMKDNEQIILTITTTGYGKCTSAYAYRITNRGGKGITNILLTKKSKVIFASQIDKNTEMILITKLGKIIRLSTKQIRIIGRTTKGVRLFKLSNNDEVISVTSVCLEDEIEEDNILFNE